MQRVDTLPVAAIRRRRYLRIWMADRLAVARGGLAFARRFERENRATPWGATAATAVREAELDLASLRAAARALGVRPDRLKLFGAVLGERVGRLKFNGHLLGYSPLSRVEELEGMLMLACQRRATWLALERLSRVEPRLSSIDLEARRRAAARQAELYEVELIAALNEL